MEPRKRRVSDLTLSEQTFSRPTKRTQTIPSILSDESVQSMELVKSDKHNHMSTIGTVPLQTRVEEFSVTTKPSVITPLNSFHDIRRVSHLEEVSVSTSRSHEENSEQDSSDDKSRDSPVFQLSVEKNEDLFVASPRPRLITGKHQSQVSLNDPCSKHLPLEYKVAGAASDLRTFSSVVSGVDAKPQQDKRTIVWGPRVLILVVFLFVAAWFLTTPVVVIDDLDSIYVPGGGFSGFWFTLGRLNSIEDPLEKKYYCYSAGCLGAVTMLSNITMEAAYGYASGAQKRWQRGELSRYDVTEVFINGLLYGTDQAGEVTYLTHRPVFDDPRVLSTLRIITSERTASRGVKAAIRTPQNFDELKEMLLQTAWIPFAISRELWHQEHMDGAFTLHEHPHCPKNLGYGLDWDIILNALNVNLGYEKVALLWQKGLSQGV